jgi:hypothetical protein
MNPKVCLETSDEGPGQPMGSHWPFYLSGGAPPFSSCPEREAALPEWGISSFVAFTSTSTKWAEWTPVDESDFTPAPTSRGDQEAQGSRRWWQ